MKKFLSILGVLVLIGIQIIAQTSYRMKDMPMVSEPINGEMTIRYMTPAEAQSASKNQKRRAPSIITNNTAEGIEMTFMVLSEEEKTCQVGTGEGNSASSNDAAINNSYNGIITIPSKVNGYKVVQIGNGAFCSCAINAVNIPITIESINFCAFSDCQNLMSVNIRH